MTCREAELLAQRYYDREITIDEYRSLREHLRTCPRCLDDWLATTKAIDLIAALPPGDCPRSALHAGIMMRLPPRRRRYSQFAWQAAAAILVIAAVAGTGFITGYRRLTATVVENRNGQTVVIPKPGRPFVIPSGAVVRGDLNVQGDVRLEGDVAGRVNASGRIIRDNTRELGRRLIDALRGIWRLLTRSWTQRRASARIHDPWSIASLKAL